MSSAIIPSGMPVLSTAKSMAASYDIRSATEEEGGEREKSGGGEKTGGEELEKVLRLEGSERTKGWMDEWMDG